MIRALRAVTISALFIGICALAPAQNNSPFTTNDPLAQALQQNSVYVGNTLRDQIDTAALQQITQQAPADRPLKIAVLNQLPESGSVYGTRAAYTKALHDYLGLGRGTLFIVTKKGVSAATDAVPPAQITEILRRDIGGIQRDPVNGIRTAVADLDAAAGGGTTSSATLDHQSGGPLRDAPAEGFPGWLIGVPLALAGGGAAVWAVSRYNKQQKALQQARVPVERLRREVLEGLTYADTYLDLLPASPDRDAAREARQKAAALLEQAGGLAGFRDRRTAHRAENVENMERAQALLEQAKQETDQARAAIDRATGGTGTAIGLDGTEYKATPVLPDGTANTQAAPVAAGLNAEDIPPAERGVCFFCSRPSRISDLTPVTVAINGQRRKVLACADDVRTVQQGAAPAVRTVPVNGQSVPWYRSSSYDPYRDYSVSYTYAPGYGYGYGVMDGLMWGALLSQPAPFAYPVFVDSSGGYSNDPVASTLPYDTPELQDAGSADFFGAGGSDFASGNDNSGDFGSQDFGNDNSGGWDSGGDSGGFDSGGADFGSGDFGGGDFGGGDSGGGGGDF